jgi:hypothetical protein
MYNIVEYLNPNFFLEYRKKKITYHGTAKNINQINGYPKVIGSFGVPGGGCNLDLLILSIKLHLFFPEKENPSGSQRNLVQRNTPMLCIGFGWLGLSVLWREREIWGQMID